MVTTNRTDDYLVLQLVPKKGGVRAFPPPQFYTSNHEIVAATMIDKIHISQDPLGVQMYYIPQGHLQHLLVSLLFPMFSPMLIIGFHVFRIFQPKHSRRNCGKCIIKLLIVQKSQVLESIKLLFAVAGTMIFKELAGASLSMAFVNVTGFSVISGLGMAMDGITSQAFGAQPILVFFGQDPKVASLAATYTYFTIPTLFLQCFFHPIKVCLRAKKLRKGKRLVKDSSLFSQIVSLGMKIFSLPYLGGVRAFPTPQFYTSNHEIVAATMIDIIHVSQDPLGVQTYYFPQGHLQHVLESIKLLFAVAGTMIFTGLHIFKLAGASLSMAFVNVTGFSVISGLGMAMDGITSQAFGARNFSLMARTHHQTILILLCG
ncbi:multidrug and toxin extrusion protein 2 [Artemisia annua]|uniref:Multidrug and toxin extrusion protein 2 n=1 Tax=Artemisia annua TaxID=35608 RepID=A0A2U1LS36_ARTAN|nr:multidrug and toxin extrusion protein 2 [Artemisia annua]